MAGKSNSANPGNTAQANHFMSGKRQETEEKKIAFQNGPWPNPKSFSASFSIVRMVPPFSFFVFGQLLLETRQMLPTGLWLQLIYIGKLGKNFDEGLCEVVNCCCLFQVKREFLNFMRLNHSIFSYFCVKIWTKIVKKEKITLFICVNSKSSTWNINKWKCY